MTAMVMTMILMRLTADPPPRRASAQTPERSAFYRRKTGTVNALRRPSRDDENCLLPDLYAARPREVRRRAQPTPPPRRGV